MLYPMGSRIRVYVVDDSDFFEDVLVKMMRAAPDLIVAGETDCWDQAMVQVAEIRPQVVVVNTTDAAQADSMPVLRLRELYPTVRIIALIPQTTLVSERVLWKVAVNHLVDRRSMDTGLLPAIRAQAVSWSEAH